MKIKILVSIFLFMFVSTPVFAQTKTNLLNTDMITVKTNLDNLYYKAQAGEKLTSKELNELTKIKASADAQKKQGNTNFVPIYYKLGNIYKKMNKKEEAIYCYRTIVKYYPSSYLAKKSIMNLKYLGATYYDENGQTRIVPEEDEETK